MRLGTIEDIGDSLALVRRKGGDVNKRLDILIPCSPDHGPSVSVTRTNDRPRSSLQRALNRRQILSKRRQGNGAASTLTPSAASGPMTLAQLDPSAQAPCTSTTLTFSRIGSLLVLRDQSIGDVIQVRTDDLRLLADPQEAVVAGPLDQGSLPADSDGAKGVPCMASDKIDL
jgi:hypothetical protein